MDDGGDDAFVDRGKEIPKRQAGALRGYLLLAANRWRNSVSQLGTTMSL